MQNYLNNSDKILSVNVQSQSYNVNDSSIGSIVQCQAQSSM